MKARKLLSMLLTFSIIISCFASLSIISVSAHQNYRDEITFDEIANATGTIAYETMCNISIRLPRIYIKDDKEQEIVYLGGTL